jgi:hypothetical protein
VGTRACHKSDMLLTKTRRSRMPASRQVERVLVNRDAESRAAGARIPVNLVFRIPHSLESLGEGERVAVDRIRR